MEDENNENRNAAPNSGLRSRDNNENQNNHRGAARLRIDTGLAPIDWNLNAQAIMTRPTSIVC